MFFTFEKIKELADKQGISLNKLEENLGFSRNTIYNMKKSTPNIERVSKIADYFNVSTDYLLGRTDNPVIAGEKVTKIEIYHEIGHKEHDPGQYQRRREEYELQADRNMIHYLLKEELEAMDDTANFNYIHFMEKYNLKSITNEIMVKEEYLALLN